MFLFQEFHGPIDRFLRSRSRKGFALAWVVVLACLAGVSLIFLLAGAPLLSGWPMDTTMFLDGGWRLMNGQTPHKDFYLIWGELPIYVTWLGMKLGFPGVASLSIGNLFVMVFVGLAAMLLLWRRTGAFYAALLSVFVALLSMAPRSLGDPYDLTGYAMVYNRYGESFLLLIGIIWFIPTEGAARSWADWLEAVFVGICVGLLLFSKLNYFAVGLGLCGLACFRGKFSILQVLIAGVVALPVIAGGLAVTHAPLSAMLSDYHIMIAAQDSHDRFGKIFLGARHNFFQLALLWLLIWEFSKKQGGVRKQWMHFALVAILYLAEMALVASNAKGGEYVLVLPAFYCAELIRRQSGAASGEELYFALRNFVAAIFLLIFVMPTLGADAKSIRRSTFHVLSHDYIVPETLRGTRLADMRFPVKEEWGRHMVTDFRDSIDEGMQLIQRHGEPGMRLAVFCFANPFHLALGQIPQEGGVLCWSTTGFTAKSHPPLAQMVGNAKYILMDTGVGYYLEEYGSHCEDSYGKELDDLHMQLLEQTKHFRLYKLPERH